jgi:beta-N-acetylhexosaminidase
MGTRAAAAEPENVIQYARAFLSGLASHRITGCAKHFPGLGGGTLDSHLATPAIHRAWLQLWQEDLLPYRKLATGSNALPMVMVSHATYLETRGGNSPATASPFWVTTVLQKRIGYRGLILSDDMEMGGILNFLPIEEAAIAAIRAGMHLLEICHSPELILRSYESLIHEAERSTVFRKLLLDRAETTRRLRAIRFAQSPGRALSARQLATLADKVRRFGTLVEETQ